MKKLLLVALMCTLSNLLVASGTMMTAERVEESEPRTGAMLLRGQRGAALGVRGARGAAIAARAPRAAVVAVGAYERPE